MFRSLAALIAVAFCLTPCAVSASGQTADRAREQLQDTKHLLKAASERQKTLEKKKSKLERELKALEEETVTIARETGAHEQELSQVEEKMAILEEQKKQKAALLEARQTELSHLISGMIRLRRMPPEAVIVMPGKLNETLDSARAVNLVSHAIEDDAASLRAQVRELDELEGKIRKNRETMMAQKSELEEKRATLAKKIEERTKLQGELDVGSEHEKEEIAALTAKSRNLQDLLGALGKSEQESLNEDIKTNAVRKNESSRLKDMRPFSAAKGKIHWPAAGKVVKHYGDGDDSAAHGITIQTREKAGVVAPYDGEVVYAGRFRDYGRIVIIRHGNDYHTLLSGMEHINCTPGQYLMEGEPVGVMGEAPEERRLYMEIRKSGKPFDPTSWLRG